VTFCFYISIDDRRRTLTFDPTPTACLPCVDFERHLISVGSSSGAHFDRCAYFIDLTQY